MMEPPPLLPCAPNRHPKKPSRDTFPILSLPAELRIQIYEAAFILPVEIDATYRKPSPQPYLIPVALLRTCRQIYQEAYGMLYEHNTFHVGSACNNANYGIAWLGRIGNNVKLVRKVVVDIHESEGESRVLPFTVFLFELRAAAPRLEELSVFAEKHRGSALKGQIMIVHELQKFSNLKKLTLGGDWKSFFGTWPDDVFPTLKDRHETVYFIEAGSKEWKERKDWKKAWAIKIAAEAREIEWRVGIERIISWADEWTRDLSGDLRLAWEEWMQDYFYAEGEEDQRLILQRGRELVLNSKAYKEKGLRATGCGCRHCRSVKDRPYRRDIGLNCYDIHEQAIDSKVLTDEIWEDPGEESEPNLLRGITLAHTWGTLHGRSMDGIRTSVVSEKTLVGLRQHRIAQDEETPLRLEQRRNENIEKCRDELKNSNEIPIISSEKQLLPMTSAPPAVSKEKRNAGSRLRREPRHWYGRPPSLHDSRSNILTTEVTVGRLEEKHFSPH